MTAETKTTYTLEMCSPNDLRPVRVSLPGLRIERMRHPPHPVAIQRGRWTPVQNAEAVVARGGGEACVKLLAHEPHLEHADRIALAAYPRSHL